MKKLAFLVFALVLASCTQEAPVLGTPDVKQSKSDDSKTPTKCIIKEGENCHCTLCDVV